MSRLTKQYKKNPYMITASRLALARVPMKSARAEVEALFYFVRSAVRYTQDITDTELVIAPDVLLRDIHAGDCDDMSLVLATLLESVGYKTRFVACGFQMDELTHVFVQVKMGRDWFALDTTEPYPPGWTPPDASVCYVEHN